MTPFDGESFVNQLELLGLHLSTTRLADGSFRVNKWRLLAYWDNEARVEEIWRQTIDENSANRSSLAAYLVKRNGSHLEPVKTSSAAA
jgi:hypothetical protein